MGLVYSAAAVPVIGRTGPAVIGPAAVRAATSVNVFIGDASRRERLLTAVGLRKRSPVGA